MAADDILNNPKAQEWLRRGVSQRPRVTQEKHKRRVQELLLEAYQHMSEVSGRFDPGEPDDVFEIDSITRMSDAYFTILRDVSHSLSIVPTVKDLEDFLKGSMLKQAHEGPESLGIFLTFFANEYSFGSDSLVFDLRGAPEIECFGFRLNKDVVIRADLGDLTSLLMKPVHLVIEGNCGDNIGFLMEGGHIEVKGTVGYSAPLKRGGRITHRGERHELEPPAKEGVLELLKLGKGIGVLDQLHWQLAAGSPATLDFRLKDYLHPSVLQTVCQHNLEIFEQKTQEYGRQVERLMADGDSIFPQFRRKKIDTAVPYGIKGLVAAGITAVFPLAILVTGPYVVAKTVKAVKDVNKHVREMDDDYRRIIREIERVGELVDQTVQAQMQACEFYLDLPGVQNSTARAEFENLKREAQAGNREWREALIQMKRALESN